MLSVKMCESLLKNVLSGSIELDIFTDWLKEGNTEETFQNDVQFQCAQGEFILYFLNYLHEETSSFLHFSNQGTPIKIRTPRRVDPISASSRNVSSCTKSSTKRTALFPDTQKSYKNENFLGVSALESEDRNSCHSFVITSTPNRAKGRSSFERSLQEPDGSLSPIYSKHRLETDSRSSRVTPKSGASPGLCLGDFIVHKKAKKKPHKNYQETKEVNGSISHSSNKPNIENCLNQSNLGQSFEPRLSTSESNNLKNRSYVSKHEKRRINPTSLSHETGRISTPNSFSFQQPELLQDKFENSRELLQEERLKILNRSKLAESNLEPLRIPPRSLSFSAPQPQIDLVTHIKQLEILAEIYSVLLDSNLVLNVLSELYFLISLLQNSKTREVTESTNVEELRKKLQNSLTDFREGQNGVEDINSLLRNVHNCVYFAANVLNKQCRLLSALDRTSLKLLLENSRLKVFVPDLVKKLAVFHGRKAEKRRETYSSGVGENVSFISDTDNRENFPNDASFHAFRKQRDLFYELLRLWESNHLQSGWIFSTALGNKVRALIFFHSDPVNLMHLARLFKNQLLAECCSQATDSTPLPTGLANVDAGKLCRLRDRLVSKKSTGGPSPEPSFPGRQEFYKEFITVSSSPAFCRHLIDCLVVEILQLDDTSSWPDSDSDSVVDSGIRSLYINTLRSSKVLAKFLGFLDALPYKTDYCPNHQLLMSQITIRRNFVPSIDVVDRLAEALQLGKLSLTVPWMTDYLAMLDHATLRLPYFSKLIETLYEIHYQSPYSFQFSSKLECVFLIKLCLGWLFERTTFPLESYQRWIFKKYEVKETSLIKFTVRKVNGCDKFLCVDHLGLVDESVLFACCPYLIEIRNCLSSDPNSRFNRSGPPKYIRPVSTVGENSDTSKKRQQKQLHEAFFHNQPSSTKRTIDLISERVASSCVKNICNNLVPSAKTKYLNQFKIHLEHISQSEVNDVRLQISLCCVKYANDFSHECFDEFKKLCQGEISQHCEVRCENSLKALLSDDVHHVTRSTCVSIAVQQTIDKIQEWFTSHVNPGIFLKEFVSEMENMKHGNEQSKKITYRLPPRGRNVEHDHEAKSPVVLLANIRELMYKILESPEDVLLEMITDLLQDAVKTCDFRCDLNPVAQFTANRMFFDMFFMLAARRPDLALESSILDTLLLFWSKYLHKSERETFFDRVLCPRNVTMFEESLQEEKTWDACASLITGLLKQTLLKSEQFEKQTVAMFRFEWPPGVCKHFTRCLQAVVEDYVQRTGRREDFTFIVGWLANYCADDEFF